MHKRYLLLILGIAAILLCLAARSKPIGYLHSWNQITTLTHISAIVDDPASWHLPHDRVAPLPHPIKTIQVAKPYDDFRVFEEFPLYHLLAAAVSHLGMSVEDAGRILSLLFWALGAVGIYMVATLAAQPAVAALTLLLYCCSLPVAYYGVAIMSDTAMTTLWIRDIFATFRIFQAHIRSSLAFVGFEHVSTGGLQMSSGSLHSRAYPSFF